MGFRNKRTGKRLSEDIKQMEREFKKLIKKFPGKLAEFAQEEVDENFQTESYDGKKKWAGRKKDKEASLSRDKRRALLVWKGELIADVKAEEHGNTVTIGTDIVYAKRHNEGLDMTERQFMPKPGEDPPASLIKKGDAYLDKESDRIFK